MTCEIKSISPATAQSGSTSNKISNGSRGRLAFNSTDSSHRRGQTGSRMLAAQKGVVASHELPFELMDQVADARRRSDALFSLVRADSLYERPIPERHRIVFYVGHLEAFDRNLLGGSDLGLKSTHPDFDRLFAFGIDPVGGGLPNDLPSDWPSPDALREYVNHVRNTLDKSLAKIILEPDSQTLHGFPLRTLLNVAVEHRLMHVETLAYMLH